MDVVLLRSGNRLVVDPTTPEVFAALAAKLTYESRQSLHGWQRKVQGKSVVITTHRMFAKDHAGRLVTPMGMYQRVVDTLKPLGHSVRLRTLPRSNATPFYASDRQAAWDNIFDPRWRITLREGQEAFLTTLATRVARWLPARFDCPPAFGKSFVIGLVARMYPAATIHVVTKRVAVLRDRIYPELCMMVPDVGIVGGGQRTNNKRVQLYTADSLHHSTGAADILIVDECHESGADDMAKQLAKYDQSVNFGFSATHDMRLDNKDMRVEAMFGPIVYSMSYAQAVAAGLVVPIQVYWRDVRMAYNPCQHETDSVERKRHGVWRNSTRNALIAQDARRYDADTQVLITCETVEHLLHLKKQLPEYEVVYSEQGIKPGDTRYYQGLGVWPDGMPVMTSEHRANLTAAFETGRLKRVIATTVWNVGVSFNNLRVLIRADAGGSAIMDTQIPGRTSRLSPADGKEAGIVHDYRDQFDSGFQRRARQRAANYAAQHWRQSDIR